MKKGVGDALPFALTFHADGKVHHGLKVSKEQGSSSVEDEPRAGFVLG